VDFTIWAGAVQYIDGDPVYTDGPMVFGSIESTRKEEEVAEVARLAS
jgi:hypothetical protein